VKTRLVVVSLAGIVCAAQVWAQASAGFGSVSGVVIQAGAEGLPEASVILSNTALGTQITLISSDDGVFHFAAVVPAAGYTLRVTRKDFESWESGAFSVATGQTVSFQIPLDAAGTAAKDNPVPAGSSHMEMNQTGTAEGVTAAEVDLLPASGRRLDDLIDVAPLVTSAESKPGLLVTRSLPFTNALLADGVLAANTYFTQQPGAGRAVSQDAVQDFQVLASAAPAEYGGAMGGIVNLASRSGTKSYHGSAYEYFRPRGLGAYDAYAAGFDTRQRQHEFGADMGGPIYGDRLFFFANLEAQDRSGQGLNRITNPLIADPTGRTVLASNCTASAAQCAAAIRFLQPQMNVLEPVGQHSVTGSAKIDYRRSERNSLSFEVNAMHDRAPSLAETGDVAPNGGLLGDPTMRDETRYGRVDWIGMVSPDTVNDLRLGWYQDRISEYPNPAHLSTGLLGISIAGTSVGQPQPFVSILPSEHRFQLVDNFHRTYNSHLFQVGSDWSRTRDLTSWLANPAGTYTYPSLTAFAQDFTAATSKNYTNFTQTLGSPLTILHTREINLYAQDTWKPSSRLTLEFGLRYERPFLPQPTAVNPVFYQTSTISTPWLNLAPRFGLAYMVDDKTVFRAGFGWFYQPFSGQLLSTLFLGNGLYQPSISVNPNQVGAPAFPNAIPYVNTIPVGSEMVAYANSKLRNPYAEDINLAVERSILKDSTVTVSYIRTRGYRMWTASDTNLAAPTITETYKVDNAAGQAVNTFTTPYYTSMANPNYSHVYQINNNGSFWYNALAVQGRTRFSRGFSLWASYTWAHAIDDLGVNSGLGFSLVPASTGDVNSDRGRSALDQRQRAVVRWTWEPQLAGGQDAVLRHLVNGWALSGIATLASAQPVTPLVLVQGQQFSAVTMAFTSSLNGSGGWSRVPFDAVNSLSAGAPYSINARLARTFTFRERIKGIVGFEAFNLLNRQYATTVNAIAYLSVSPLAPGLINGPHTGSLLPVSGLGAGVAAQGFPDGTNARRAEVAFRVAF
jgi:hypothetical protein